MAQSGAAGQVMLDLSDQLQRRSIKNTSSIHLSTAKELVLVLRYSTAIDYDEPLEVEAAHAHIDNFRYNTAHQSGP